MLQLENNPDTFEMAPNERAFKMNDTNEIVFAPAHLSDQEVESFFKAQKLAQDAGSQNAKLFADNPDVASAVSGSDYYKQNFETPLKALQTKEMQEPSAIISDIEDRARAFNASFKSFFGVNNNGYSGQLDVEATKKYPGASIVGSLVAQLPVMIGTMGLGEAIGIGKVAGLAGEAMDLPISVPMAKKAVSALVDTVLKGGLFGAVTETERQIVSDKEGKDFAEMGTKILDSAVGSAVGFAPYSVGALIPSRVTGTAVITGLTYALGKAQGLDEPENLLNSVALGSLHAVMGGGSPKESIKAVQDTQVAYLMDKNDLINKHKAVEIVDEHLNEKAIEILKASKEELGETVEIKGTALEAVAESPELTQKLLTGVIKDSGIEVKGAVESVKPVVEVKSEGTRPEDFKTAEEYVASFRQMYHQTTEEGLKGIKESGFKIIRGKAGLGDELPVGINTKTSPSLIRLEGKEQLGAYLPKNAKVKDFANRESVVGYLRNKSDEYNKIIFEKKATDVSRGRELDALEKEELDLRKDTSISESDKKLRIEELNRLQDELLEKWKKETDDAGDSAAKIASKILLDEGLDAIYIKEDVGGVFGNQKTDNLIVLKEGVLKPKSQLTSEWEAAQKSKGSRPEDFATAEEYVASKGAALKHGTAEGTKIDRFSTDKANWGVGSNAFAQGNKGVYLTDDTASARYFSRKANEFKSLMNQDIGPLERNDSAWQYMFGNKKESGENVVDVYLSKDARIKELDYYPSKEDIENIIKSGDFDAVRFPEEGMKSVEDIPSDLQKEIKPSKTTFVFNLDKIQTKSQLTAEWQKSQEAKNANKNQTGMEGSQGVSKEVTPSQGEFKPEQTPSEGTGKEKRRGLSESVEETAIKEGLTKELGDLPTYKTRNIEDVARRVSDFINKDYEKAKGIALGELPEEGGLRSQELYTGIRIKATVEGDVNTLRDLALSEKASAMATELGQRVQALDTGEASDPVSVIKDLKKTRETEVEKKLGKNKLKSQKKSEATKIKKSIRTEVNKLDWNSFLSSLEC